MYLLGSFRVFDFGGQCINMVEDKLKNDNQSYRQIMKATSIFGGVQVFNVLISILRSKIVAVLMGPAGIGLLGLFTSTILLISNLTNFGLGISAIKDISVANETNESDRISKTVSIVERLIWFTGLFGALVTLLCSSWLSELTFGHQRYTLAFVWLSATVLFNQVTSGQHVLLQGLRRLKDLARSNMIGSGLGLALSVPLYYYMGLEGIVPAMVITALIIFLVSKFYSAKVNIKKVNVTLTETRQEGKGMLLTGLLMTFSGAKVIAEAYVVRIFINNVGTVEEVGLYNAGIALVNTYVGLLFTAMQPDFFSRLALVANDNEKAKALMNQQLEITILILAPILLVLMVFINWVIIILYSAKFVTINMMIYWAFLGLFFRATAWVVGFLFIAKGKSRLFFWSELASTVYLVGLNLLGYYYGGLEGLGIGLMCSYLIYTVQIYILIRVRYGFGFSGGFKKIFLLQFTLALICVILTKIVISPWAYFVALPFIALSIVFSFKELDRRMQLSGYLKNFLKR